MKGVILAGGTGSRLHPLTRITNKHLLPIWDRPMINYAIEALVKGGVSEMMLVTGGTHAGEFLRLLGNGDEFGIHRLLYAYQDKPGGIAEALGLAEKFVGGDRAVVLLGDNIFERSIRPCVDAFKKQNFNIVPNKSLDDAKAWLAGEMSDEAAIVPWLTRLSGLVLLLAGLSSSPRARASACVHAAPLWGSS